MQTIAANIGAGELGVLQSPQPPSTEAILTALLNEITTIPDNFIFVLDDYHIIDSKPVDNALTFLLEHLPPRMHLVIATREDPHLPLARLRARGQLTELRAADLRFTSAEAAEFLNRMMGLNLTPKDISALEAHTEGWIAGLQQLAALSIQGREDIAGFIQVFTGSHRFVLDYLVEEVLERQPEHICSFLLQTVILDRFSAPLCNAVTEREDGKEMLDVPACNSTYPPGTERAADPDPRRARRESSRSLILSPAAALPASASAANAEADEAIPAPDGKLFSVITSARSSISARPRMISRI